LDNKKFPVFNVPQNSSHPSTFTLKTPFNPVFFICMLFQKIIKSFSFFTKDHIGFVFYMCMCVELNRIRLIVAQKWIM
jgi:hypothetical protein